MVRGTLLPTLAVLVLLVPIQATRLRATAWYVASRTPEDLYYLPPPRWLRTLDVGYHDAFADVLWATALVYTGDGLRNRMGAKHVIAYARGMTTLDPSWQRPYRWAPIAASYQAVAPSIEQMVEAGQFVSEGVARFPESGEVAWAAGTFFSYELAPRFPIGSPERAEARRRGLVYLSDAARRGAGPAWLALANASSMSQVGNLELAIEHLREVYALTTDVAVREQIAERLRSLGETAQNAAATEADARERDRLERYPYLPPGLFELIGPSELDRPAP